MSYIQSHLTPKWISLYHKNLLHKIVQEQLLNPTRTTNIHWKVLFQLRLCSKKPYLRKTLSKFYIKEKVWNKYTFFTNLGDTNWTSNLKHLEEALTHKPMVKVTTQEPHKDFQRTFQKWILSKNFWK